MASAQTAPILSMTYQEARQLVHDIATARGGKAAYYPTAMIVLDGQHTVLHVVFLSGEWVIKEPVGIYRLWLKSKQRSCVKCGTDFIPRDTRNTKCPDCRKPILTNERLLARENEHFRRAHRDKILAFDGREEGPVPAGVPHKRNLKVF